VVKSLHLVGWNPWQLYSGKMICAAGAQAGMATASLGKLPDAPDGVACLLAATCTCHALCR
jgi:hypothetical protein